MTDEASPEQPPARTEMEQLRDTAQTLQTIVNRVREAVGTDEPAPVRESYRVRVLETRVSDAEYERDHARQRAEQAEAGRLAADNMLRAVCEVFGGSHQDPVVKARETLAHAERAAAAIERVRAARDRMARGRNVDAIWCLDVLDAALAQPGPAATEATELETTARVLSGLHRSAEDTVTRVIDLYEQWVKAGPPPLGTSVARWWDARLVELHDAIQPPADQTTEK